MEESKFFYNIINKDLNCNVTGHFMRKPKIVDIVEYDGDELKVPENLLYFRPPQPRDYPLDLNAVVDNYKWTRPHTPYLYKLSRYLMSKNADLNFGETDEQPREVITQIKTLQTLMETTSNYNIDWKLNVIKYNNKLYLSKHFDDQFTYPASSHRDDHFKLRQLCFTDDPHSSLNLSSAICKNSEKYCIYTTFQNNLKYIYSAAIDGIISEKKIEDLNNLNELNKCQFVNTRLLNSSIIHWRTNYRMFSWWIKAYLSGVNDIYMGRKSMDGLVLEPLQHIAANTLPEGQRWKPEVCFNFMHTFLNKVFDEMSDVNCPYTCYEFHYDCRLRCIKLTKHHGKTVHSFLAEDYVEFITKA